MKQKGFIKTIALSLGALGVVYGDIGTSPLYAVNELFFGHKSAHINRANVLESISLVLWALTIMVTIKYVVLILRADSDGEGGVFALFSLLRFVKSRTKPIVATLLIVAAGLLIGDGIITPAISVISAVEGLKVITPQLATFVVPITIIILSGLFFIQKKGTAKIGKVFGPIILVWFIIITILGAIALVANPEILLSINPYYAFQFFLTHDLVTTFLALGAVTLVITGGEAMYADMGHFGKPPIRLSWFAVVYPALLINYLGQGAYLLSGKEIVGNNIFYNLVPTWGLIPMVILATFATIIASQALISGAFSLITQAISLGLVPYMKVVHTHFEHEGQIYVPLVNWSLYVGCILLVIVFQSSNRLASAYGLAVAGVMLITTFAVIQVARYIWKWSTALSLIVFLPLAFISGLFVLANSLKLLEGGYIPLSIGFVILIVMHTWQWGRGKIREKFKAYPTTPISTIIDMKKAGMKQLPRSFVFMTPDLIKSTKDNIPPLTQIFMERYGMLPRNIVFLTVEIVRHPHVPLRERSEIFILYDEKDSGSIVSVNVRFGFMEDPNVEEVLSSLSNHKELYIDRDFSKWLIEVIHEMVVRGKIKGFLKSFRYSLFKFMSKNANNADHYFGLGIDQPLSIEVFPVVVQ